MDPFATLGLQRRYQIDMADLERRYRELQKALHPDRHSGAPASHRRMNVVKAMEVNEAYRTLRDDLKRAEVLLELHGVKPTDDSARAEPEFLMEMMELREALAAAKGERDLTAVRDLLGRVEGLRRHAREALGERFARSADPSVGDLAVMAQLAGRLRYFQRFADEAELIEEELE